MIDNFPPEAHDAKPVALDPRLRQAALQDFYKERSKMPFVWGTNDCVLCAAEWVRICTGIDYAAPLRGYTTRQEAQQILLDHGGITGLITKMYGEPINPAFATIGDMVLIDNEGRETCGVYNGGTTLVSTTKGMTATNRPLLAAWRV